MSAAERFVDIKDAMLSFAGQSKFAYRDDDMKSCTMKAASTASFPT